MSRAKHPIRAQQPIVRQALELVEDSGTEGVIITKQAGIYRNGISMWRRGLCSPNVGQLEAVLNVIGYRLAIVRNDD